MKKITDINEQLTNSGNLIPHGYPGGAFPVTVESLTCTYAQETDDNDYGHEPQKLTLSTEDAGAGVFFVAKTERWAIDSPESFAVILNDFKSRVNLAIYE
jgi:hypothetical protein